MDRLFGRTRSSRHRFAGDLRRYLSSMECLERAFALNVMHDDRVSRKRETEFRKIARKYVQSERVNQNSRPDLSSCIAQYYLERVHTAGAPDFLDNSINRSNLFRPAVRTRKLARILDLSDLATPLRRYATESKYGMVFRRFLNGSQTYANWLDDRMKPGSRPNTLTAIFDCLRISAETSPFHPTWVTMLDGLEMYLAEGPDRWLEVLGMPARSGHWLVILGYDVRDAGPLYRPTQLDAATSGYHFPTPRAIRARAGGHPVDLGELNRPAALLPEWIHGEITHDISHVRRAGKTSPGFKPPPSLTGLHAYRARHYGRLVSEYGHSIVESWMLPPDLI
jgi:hypothetical protein